MADKKKPITPVLSPLEKDKQKIKFGKTMGFPEAIREVINGKRIRRLSWEDVREYGCLKDGWLKLFRPAKAEAECNSTPFFLWRVNDGDLMGEDWVVVGEMPN